MNHTHIITNNSMDELNSSYSEEETKDDIKTMLKFINDLNRKKGKGPLDSVTTLYNCMTGHVWRDKSNVYRFMAKCSSYRWSNTDVHDKIYVDKLYENCRQIVLSINHFIIDNKREKKSGGYTHAFVVDDTLFYGEDNHVYSRSFSLINEKLKLGNIIEVNHEQLLNVFYNLPDLNKFFIRYLPNVSLKQYPCKNISDANISIVFDNNIIITLPEMLLATCSSVFNMLYYRDGLRGVWNIPFEPTPKIAEIITEQIITNNTLMLIGGDLTMSELYVYMDIFTYLGLSYELDSD